MRRGGADGAILDRSLQRNVETYVWYRAASDMFAWLPVFFLYFSEHLALRDVIRLEALYYVSVVSLELPSGYFSDRVGRRPTLVISALSFVLAYACFLAGGGLALFAAGQVLLAAGIAFRSGTDTALHYDSLAGLGRQGEYAAREARVERAGLTATAIAVLAGGFVGTLDLRWPYILSLGSAIVSLSLAWRFVEVGRRAGESTPAIGKQFRACADCLAKPVLAWVFGFHVILFALAHVPYEFYQPYLALLDSEQALQALDAPAMSGVVFAMSIFGGAWAAGRSVDWQKRFGLPVVLLAAAGLQWLVIVGLASNLHVAVLGLVLLRNLPMALSHAPVNAAIAPRVGVAQRATYLSLQSLAGRLGFSGVLFVVSFDAVPGDAVDWPTLASILSRCAGIGLIALLALALTSPLLRRGLRQPY